MWPIAVLFFGFAAVAALGAFPEQKQFVEQFTSVGELEALIVVASVLLAIHVSVKSLRKTATDIRDEIDDLKRDIVKVLRESLAD